MAIRVEMEACTAGNPLKAWKGTEGEHDTEHVPDDVWETKVYDFGDDLEAAKAYIRVLDAPLTTHVKLYADDALIFDQDAGADHLDDAAPDVEMPHTIDAGGPVEETVGEVGAFAPPDAAIATEVQA